MLVTVSEPFVISSVEPVISSVEPAISSVVERSCSVSYAQIDMLKAAQKPLENHRLFAYTAHLAIARL